MTRRDNWPADPSEFGTLYDTFRKTVETWPDNDAYCAPAMAGRSYHPAGKTYTWAETGAAVEQLRNKYMDAGYGPGHRVSILFDQRPEFFFHYYALNGLGCSVVPINPDYRPDEIAYVVEHSESILVLAVEHRMGDIKTVSDQLGGKFARVVFDEAGDNLPEAWSPAGSFLPDGSTEAGLLYTSGTTGRPKGCVLTNEYFHTFGSWYVTRGGLLSMRDGSERMYNPLPLHHANCLSISAPAMLLTGGCLVFPDRFHASTWWDDIVACEVTAVHMQGIIPNLLLKLPVHPGEKTHRVRFGLCAGVEPSHHEGFEQRFGFPLVEMWAMTETGRLLTDNVEPRLIHTRAFGKPVPGLEAAIFNDQDQPCPDNTPGELVIRHNAETPRKGFFSGYLKNEEATEDAWRKGWFHTGDVAMRDATGMFYFLDRMKNIIRRSGENIAAAEVEACLTAHDKVKQVAVLAAPDELRDEEVYACVVASRPDDAGPGLAEELLDWCIERMAYFKAPAWYLFVDTLPTTTSQKVRKVEIFPNEVDPRDADGAIDLRPRKKKPAA